MGWYGVFSIRFRTSSRLGDFIMPKALSDYENKVQSIYTSNGDGSPARYRPELAALCRRTRRFRGPLIFALSCLPLARPRRPDADRKYLPTL